MRLLLTLGTYHPTRKEFQQSWSYYGAVMQFVDWDRREVEREIHWTPPPEHIGGTAALLFMGAHLDPPDLFVCTKTEVLRYDARDWQVRSVFSHPYFNDLHSVIRTEDRLAVANTGREAVQIFDLEGVLQEEVYMGKVPVEERFPPDVDYRLIRSTKPHDVHLNQLFLLDGELWVTRLEPQDAVCVIDTRRRIEIPAGQPHDGRLADGTLHFTTTNGCIVFADPGSRRVTRVIDLSEQYGDDVLAGWCRGIEVVGERAFVGFTRIRRTENARHRFWRRRDERPRLPSRVVEVDLETGRIVGEMEIARHEGAAIYSIIRL